MMMMMPSKNKHSAPSPIGGHKSTRTNQAPSTGGHSSADGEILIKVVAKKPVRSSPIQGQVTSTNKADDSNNNNRQDISSSPVRDTPDNIPSTTQKDETNCRSTSPNNTNNNNNKVCNCKHSNNNNNNSNQHTRQKDKELEKLRKDLAKCQNELREEVEKRGQSSSARAAWDRERARLLKETRELGVSKRRLESALEEASSALKKKTQEVRLVKEASRQEMAALERSANLEVKKLLEDLKTKDHLLAIMDRNQYSDRSNQIKLIQKQQDSKLKTPSPNPPSPQPASPPVQEGGAPLGGPQTAHGSSLTSELQSPTKHPRKGEGTTSEEVDSLRKKINDLERQLSSASLEKVDLEKQTKDILATKQNLEATIARLRDDNMQLSSDLNAVQYEVKRLNDSLTKSNVEEVIEQFERLKTTNDAQKNIISKLQRQIKNNKQSKSSSEKSSKSKKTVRFMLPGYSGPIVNGRVAYKEDMRYLFEDVVSDDDDDYYCYHDNEIRYYFESSIGDDGDEEEDDDDNDHENSNNNNSGKVVTRETSVDGDDDDDDDTKKNDDDDDDDDDRVFKCNDDNDVRNSLPSTEKQDVNEKTTLLPSAEETGDYKLLMKEHLQLEQSIATLAQALPPHNWIVEKESLQLAMLAMENKNHEYKLMVDGLKSKVEELQEKNEELEFQVLEFEGSGNDALKKEQEIADFALIDRNHKLEQEIKSLQVQLLRTSDANGNEVVALPSTSQLEEIHSMTDAETQCNEIIEEDVLESECEQTSFMDANLTSSTSTSGFEDLSSDDENSFESMPHDEKLPQKASDSANPSIKTSKRSEECWMKHAKSLEVKLACSKMRERQLQDKLALLCEEKNRIIRDFDRYTASDTDSLIELDSGIDVKSLDGDLQTEDLLSKLRGSPALSCSSAQQLKLDFSVGFGKIGHLDDSFHVDTPTSVDFCFPKHVQSLTVEDETDALHQRVCHLEKDCELLKEIIDMDEGIIRDLQFKVEELEGSEKNLNKVVDRLEAIEKVLRASESAAIEENGRLKVELTRSRSIEENLQSQLNLTRCDETQLRHKLEEVLDELRQTESRLKKKTADSERERKSLTSANEKLEDHVGELEAVVELLKRRNQNLQRLCEDTNNKLTDTENSCKRFKAQADCMEQQRDAFVARIQILEKEKLSVVEKNNDLAKNLNDRIAEMEMLAVEIEGLRACLESGEAELERWMKKAEDRADAEVLLMKEMEELRVEKEMLEDRMRTACREMLSSANKLQKSIPPHSSIETQTEPSFTIFVGESDSLKGDDEEDTVMAVTDDDDDDASMDDVSDDDGHELDQDDLPMDDEVPPKCSSCSKRLTPGDVTTLKWGSLDSLWFKMGAKNSSLGNSKAFRDKFTQTLLPLVPYLRRMQASTFVSSKLESKSSSKVSLIPLNAKYFSQSGASSSYISRPPIKITPLVQSGCSPTKIDLQLDRSFENAPIPNFDLLQNAVPNSRCSISTADGSAKNPQSPGPCASQ